MCAEIPSWEPLILPQMTGHRPETPGPAGGGAPSGLSRTRRRRTAPFPLAAVPPPPPPPVVFGGEIEACGLAFYR